MVSYASYTSFGARGTFRIYKGSTLLYETRITGEHITTTRTRPFHHLLIAVDSTPAGNDSYSFRINITTAGNTTGDVHVQGMVIKADTAVWGYNTTAVSIASAGTGTVTSINTSFPSGSKVVVIATVYAAAATATTGDYLVGAGNIKLKSGATVVSSNQFNIGSYRDIYPLRASLIYLDTPTSGSQTYSVEITNGSVQAHNCYAEIVAFDVTDAVFLDTGSVAVGTSQTTVGNLSTTLSGDVVVIALAAAERTASTDGDTFAANAVVLQRDNSSTNQVGNLLTWYIFRFTYNARSGVLPLFRYDTGVTNPSYQVKMTASSGSPNGEAKILAFTTQAIVTVSVSDAGVGVESVDIAGSIPVGDAGSGVDVVDLAGSISTDDAGSGVEAVLLAIPSSDSGAGVDAGESMVTGLVDDAGSGSDLIDVDSAIPVEDSGTGADSVSVTAGFELITADDAGTGFDAADVAGSVYADDSGSVTEVASMTTTNQISDSGTGTDLAFAEAYQSVPDSGTGSDEVVPLKEVLDSGSAAELVDMAKDSLDAGSGLDTINSPQFNAVGDAGAGSESVLTTIPQSDSGTGSDAVDTVRMVDDAGVGIDSIPILSREVLESSAGFEAVSRLLEVVEAGVGSDTVAVGVSAEIVAVQDFATGVDTVGLVSIVGVVDAGVGVDAGGVALSIYGNVTIDGSVIVGVHSIPYTDLARDGLPIQTQRRFVDDRVYVGGVEVGVVTVEWEDKVSDIVPGQRVLRILGVVRLVD